ncbi:MAG: hypothetical protein DRG40_01770 [Deltaproteobacteria bacterium]|nr:MAG: hypothetical protein DRG40_01770 [Deltaproteobacteria bacterium]
MKIIVLHSGIPFPNGADYMAESCARAFRLLGHEVYELGGYHKGRVREIYKVLDLAEEIKPDFVLHLYGLYFPVDYVDKLNQKGIPTVLWVQNEEKEFNLTMGISHRYSLFCSYTTLTLERHKALGANVMYLPIAADHTIYHPLKPPPKKDIDVTWIGAPHRKRLELAEKLQKFFPNSFFDFSLSLPAQKVNEIYNRSKVVVGIYQDCDAPFSALTGRRCTLNTERAWGCPCRTFEVPAARAFQLQCYREDLPSVYDEDEVALAEEDELVDKVTYFLENEEERQRIAEAGYKRTIKEHLYTHRMREIIDRLIQDGLIDGTKTERGLFDEVDDRYKIKPAASDHLRVLKELFRQVAKYVRSRRVLHLKCGGGMGSEILAKRAAYVLGVDDDHIVLSFARVKHPRPNLVFTEREGLASSLLFDSICYITLEEIPQNDLTLLERIARDHLDPKRGKVFIGGKLRENIDGFETIWQKGELKILKGNRRTAR